ncbi:hypothetical protein LTR17_025841 [Elasticomyces elasticus]|nr:hypothetical protein LTR17_025841 [Elasticomyces elasticus]
MFFIPENDAHKAVEKLHGRQLAIDPARAAEFYQMAHQAEVDRELKTSWMHMFADASLRERMVLSAWFAFLTQSTAILVINNYNPILYAGLG